MYTRDYFDFLLKGRILFKFSCLFLHPHSFPVIFSTLETILSTPDSFVNVAIISPTPLIFEFGKEF